MRETELLLAAPAGPERSRSGTWSTVRHAMEQGRLVCVVMQSGAVVVNAAATGTDRSAPGALATPFVARSAQTSATDARVPIRSARMVP